MNPFLRVKLQFTFWGRQMSVLPEFLNTIGESAHKKGMLLSRTRLYERFSIAINSNKHRRKTQERHKKAGKGTQLMQL